MQLYIRKIYFLILHILCSPMENIRYNIRDYYDNKIFTLPIVSDGAYHIHNIMTRVINITS